MDTDQDITTLIKTEPEHDPLTIESFPESVDQDLEDVKPLRTDVNVEIVPVEHHCLNCGCDMLGKRPHKLARVSVEVLTVIKRWIAPQLIGEEDQICHSCFIVSLRETDVEVSKEASNGRHRQLCLTCRCSLLRKRYHILNTCNERETGIRNIIEEEIAPRQLTRSDQICHPCWQRYDRQSNEPDPKNLPSVIHLPNLTRASDTQANCFYPDCQSKERRTVPRGLRVKLFIDHKFYVPQNSKICTLHLTNPNWDDLESIPNPIHKFNAKHIEDIISLLIK